MKNIGKVTKTMIVALAVAVILYVFSPLLAVPRDWMRERTGNFTGPVSGTEQDDNLKANLDLLHSRMKALYGCSGSVFYVDSSASGTTGADPDNAVSTLDAAVNLCTASAGDLIIVLEGHNEALTTADGVDIDVAGVTVVGLGNGNLKPTFDYDNANGEFVIGAANVRIVNLRFRVSANATTHAIDVEDAGDEFTIERCEFGWAETATDEFTVAVKVEDNVDYGTIKGCFFSAGGQAATHAIQVVSSCEQLIVKDNIIIGDYSTTCVGGLSGGNCHYQLILDNVLFNGTMTGDNEVNTLSAVSYADNTGGLIKGNDIIADTATAQVQAIADDMVLVDNFRATEDGDEYAGQIETAASSITASPGS